MNLDCPAAIEAAIKPNTKMIWLESPTNPLIKTTDIRKVTAVAKKHNLLTVVDATFMSPYLMVRLSPLSTCASTLSAPCLHLSSLFSLLSNLCSNLYYLLSTLYCLLSTLSQFS
jgi:alanine-alpha-ketoisovalerate/valine-pyruvate aminotransferase